MSDACNCVVYDSAQFCPVHGPRGTGYPIVKCPKCSAEQVDMDGFGFLACDVCGYCTHPSMSGTPLVCGICGQRDSAAEQEKGP